MKQISKAFFHDKGYKLLSASSISHLLNGDYLKIDPTILETAKQMGIAVGEKLIHKIIDPDYNDENEIVNKAIKTLYDAIKPLKPITAEKLVDNKYFMGYLDFECEKCFVELKCRSNDNYSLDNLIQCIIYEDIVNKPFKLFIYNKKTNKVNIYQMTDIDPDMWDKAMEIVLNIKRIMEIYNGIKTK